MNNANNGIVIPFAFDRIAIKTYGMLADAGYYASLELDVWKGYTLTVGIKPKEKPGNHPGHKPI